MMVMIAMKSIMHEMKLAQAMRMKLRTNENEQGDKHNERLDTQSGHEALPNLLPKKGTKSEV